jgi:ABC-2 type transport system ATP-binding protein
MIRIEHLVKSYNGKVAVSDLSLEIPAGSVFAFLGPNGAGKTTTAKIIVGLLKPTAGSVTVCGFDVAGQYEEVKRRVSYVPDHPYLYDKLTGREFMHFVGSMYGLDAARCEAEIEKYAGIFETHEYMDGLIESYSHGMKQRFVISAALMHDPEVIVVDEPLVGLDPKSSRLVKDLLRERAAGGAAVFMSTHMISVADETADRIGIIHRGKLIADASPVELRKSKDAKLEDVFLKMTGSEGEAT